MAHRARPLGLAATTALVVGLLALTPTAAHAAPTADAAVVPTPVEIVVDGSKTFTRYAVTPDPLLEVSWGDTIELDASALDITGGLFGAGPDGDWTGGWEARHYNAGGGPPLGTGYSAVYVTDVDFKSRPFRSDVTVSGSADGTLLFVTLPETPRVYDPGWDFDWSDESAVDLVIMGFESCVDVPVDEPLFYWPHEYWQDCDAGDGFDLRVRLELAAPDPSPSGVISATTAEQGAGLTVTASGFQSGESYEIWLHSTPVQLTTGTASATGAISQVVTIPTNVPAGAHRIEIRGATSGSVWIDITVTRVLPPTGTEATIGLLVAGGLLLAGAGAFVARRVLLRRSIPA